MRKFIIFLLLLAGLFFAYVRYLSNPTYLGAVLPPKKLAWRKVTQHTGGKLGNYTLTQVVTIDGNKWRVELMEGNAINVVAVSDAQFFASMPRLAKPEQYAPMTEIGELLKGLPQMEYLGLRTVHGVTCWGFRNSATEAWIDWKTRLPVTLVVVSETGTMEMTYKVLPLDQEEFGEELYKPLEPRSIFGQYFKE